MALSLIVFGAMACSQTVIGEPTPNVPTATALPTATSTPGGPRNPVQCLTIKGVRSCYPDLPSQQRNWQQELTLPTDVPSTGSGDGTTEGGTTGGSNGSGGTGKPMTECIQLTSGSRPLCGPDVPAQQRNWQDLLNGSPTPTATVPAN